MRFCKETSEIYVPDGIDAAAALARTTHMAVSAHQDDIEIMAMDGVLQCFGKSDKWFTGVVVTSGAGSPRDGIYADYTDDQMRAIRRKEQKKAAYVGEYSAAAFLDHSSSEMKDSSYPGAVDDLAMLIKIAGPETVYVHNPADKHPTHVCTALRLIRAIRSLSKEERPANLYGCEVWRDLDWMIDDDKVAFHLDKHENISAAVLGVFDSQIIGGKRYDLASMGRRRAHATYHQSHSVDACGLLNFGMDLTPLIQNDDLDILGYVREHIERFAAEVYGNISKFI